MRAVVAIIVALAGCTPDLPPATLVSKLRVLAVKAEPPEVTVGQSTLLSLLALEPPAVAPRPKAMWFHCPVPASITELAPCGLGGDSISATPLTNGAIDAGDDVLYASATESLIVAIVADRADGPLGCISLLIANQGVNTDPDHCVVAIKQLTLDSAPNSKANNNPTLTALDIQEAPGQMPLPLTIAGTQFSLNAKHGQSSNTLSATRAGNAAEMKPGGNYEELSVAWYADGGSIDSNITHFDPPGCTAPGQCGAVEPIGQSLNDWYAPTADEAALMLGPARVVRFWAVIRDDRGGVSWLPGQATAR